MATKDKSWVDAAIAGQLPAAAARGKKRSAREPKALQARFDAREQRICVELSNGVSMSFPPSIAQGLRSASAKDLAQIEISPQGTGLHWPAIDADLSIAGMLKGAFGSRIWMKELASRAGKSKSEAKSAAARANGAKGGRPRKVNPV
jgi:Protein of unknown function (DUF2442)